MYSKMLYELANESALTHEKKIDLREYDLRLHLPLCPLKL